MFRYSKLDLTKDLWIVSNVFPERVKEIFFITVVILLHWLILLLMCSLKSSVAQLLMTLRSLFIWTADKFLFSIFENRKEFHRKEFCLQELLYEHSIRPVHMGFLNVEYGCHLFKFMFFRVSSVNVTKSAVSWVNCNCSSNLLLICNW